MTDEARIGPWRLRTWLAPHDGADRGGDRVFVADAGGTVRFLLADASGHGTAAEPFWAVHGAAIEATFREASDVRVFGRRVNALLHGAAELCASFGELDPGGTLRSATFGYGTHVLATTARGLARAETGRLFGLRLGWVEPGAWARTPRACVVRRVEDVERLVVLSDGLLADDHRDIEATLDEVRTLGGLRMGELRERAHGDDDAALLVAEKA